MAATKQRESLLAALGRVPDPRCRRGRRYELAPVLALAVCAMVCGARSLYAIAQWGREHREQACEALGIKRLTTPDAATFHRIFRRLDVGAFEQVLGGWLCTRGLRAGEAVAVDGKTLRGIHGEQLPGVHLVAAFTHQSGIVLTQEPAPGKGQELVAVTAVLGRLDLQGHVVTGDALLAQRALCQQVVKGGALLAAGEGEPADAV
jgi:DDE_Tnp_1-associated